MQTGKYPTVDWRIALRLVKNISKPNNAATGINSRSKARITLRRKRSPRGESRSDSRISIIIGASPIRLVCAGTCKSTE
jgi:hypothetical protein